MQTSRKLSRILSLMKTHTGSQSLKSGKSRITSHILTDESGMVTRRNPSGSEKTKQQRVYSMTIIQLLMQHSAHIEKFGDELERARTNELERNIIRLFLELKLGS